MMNKPLKLISVEYLEEYSQKLDIDFNEVLTNLKSKSEFTREDFEYYFISSSLYSSKIEGNSLDVNSFFRNRGKSISPKKKEVQEIETLMAAYKFASENELNRSNFLMSHAILSEILLPINERGVLRKEQVGIRDSQTMKPVYLAVEPEFLKEEFDKLFDDIDELLKRELSYTEIFYFASIIHIWLAKIHPFIDGNGRSARLLEKWFLGSKLGKYVWAINSEKYYWDNRSDYYQNIALGYNYYSLYWNRCIPFLLMLPKALQSI